MSASTSARDHNRDRTLFLTAYGWKGYSQVCLYPRWRRISLLWWASLAQILNFGSANDLAGTVVMGKDYITGSTAGGGTSANFDGTSFEGTNYAWVFRAYGSAYLFTNEIAMNPSNASYPAIGGLQEHHLRHGPA